MSEIKIKQLEKRIEGLEQELKDVKILVRELTHMKNDLVEDNVELYNRILKLEKQQKTGELYVCK